MYEKPADKHSAGLFGLSLEEIPVEDVLIWDINWNSFDVFYHLVTQWRIGGMGSATGLDYNAIPVVGKLLGIKKKELKDIFHDIRVMENEALITMGENQKNANDC